MRRRKLCLEMFPHIFMNFRRDSLRLASVSIDGNQASTVTSVSSHRTNSATADRKALTEFSRSKFGAFAIVCSADMYEVGSIGPLLPVADKKSTSMILKSRR